uniref:Uncharacterized protein n=1 Tax=Phlebotomus papatasi TaxID=29031 RepID=A0A1B0GQ99_PHLPP
MIIGFLKNLNASSIEEHIDKGTQTEQFVESVGDREREIGKAKEKEKVVREMENSVQMVQKSKSSGNVGPLLSRRIWRGRSKSQTRPCAEVQPTKAQWTPQGKGVWSSNEGRIIELKEIDLQELTPIERKILQRVASAKLQELNFGAIVVPPEDGGASVEVKPKRRALLLKRKALTTGFFDATKKDDRGSSGGSFGQSLEQCLANEMRAISRCTVTHVRAGSCESLPQRAQESTPPIGESLSQQDLRTDSTAPTVPAIVRQCIAHLTAHGLSTVGIFRVSPARRRVRHLREEWERAGPTGINFDTTHCPHDVATLLKEFLRDLPEPLLCSALYGTFLGTQRIRNRRLQLEAIAHLLRLLPPAHRDTLRILLQFLADVARAANDAPNGRSGNRMDSTNLATVFAPNILRSSEDRVEERLDAINVIRTMIDHHEELFRVPAAILDEVYAEMMDQHGQALDRLCERRATEGAASRTDDERRRMSSPLVLHGTGVLSATLSIPVTVAPLHVGDHLEGIPFIEEQTPQEARGPQRPLATVTGTLSLAPSPSAPNTDPVFFPNNRVMRSKTEDFERPQRPRVPPSDGRRSQMVYKRREIISSAQSGRK